jgi:hypothetical protein
LRDELPLRALRILRRVKTPLSKISNVDLVVSSIARSFDVPRAMS